MQVMAVADMIAQMRKSLSHSCLVLGSFGSIDELILTSLLVASVLDFNRRKPEPLGHSLPLARP
jgi:hypothetical protein